MTAIADQSKQISGSRRIRLRGCVQGSGIRPSVARLARTLQLVGSVRNEMEGVFIEVSGSVDSMDRFAEQLRRDLPAEADVARLEDGIDVSHRPSFEIESSHQSGPTRTIVPTDKIVCEACLRDVQTPGNRRFAYPFTSCAVCGPRYSILRSMPYDRHRTSMSAYAMCDFCRDEYEDPQNRRFHAQTNCCPVCGPRLWSTDACNQGTFSGQEAMQAGIETVRDGQILAIKGVGGYQLVCDATNGAAIAELRARKRRLSKPLAVMVMRFDEAEQLAHFSDLECQSLCSPAGPIIIARRKLDSMLPRGINPGLCDIGVMFPTSPLHYLLLDGLGVPLIVTSGNVDGEPLEYREQEAQKRLAGVADRFLHHDREIVHPIDDSVVRCVADRVVTIRAARGIAPLPLPIHTNQTAIAVGGQQKVAVAISNGHQSVLGPHIGDLDSLAGRERYLQQTASLCRLYGCEADVSIHDSHPDYFTTQYDRAPLCRSVQHHHAHVVSAMVDHHGCDKTTLGFAFDGTGFGTDETIWGGEILIASAGNFSRIGHLRPFALVGGEAAIRDPTRVAIALVHDSCGKDSSHELDRIFQDHTHRASIATLLQSRTMSPITSSVGRLFDGVAAIALSDIRCNFEGEPAMLLESACDSTDQTVYELSISDDTPTQLDWRPMIRQLVDDRKRGVAAGKMAMRFHRGLASAVVQMAQRYPEMPVVISGGVFQNRVLVQLIVDLMPKHRPLGSPGLIPPNDGGLAVGQLAIAARLRTRPCA